MSLTINGRLIHEARGLSPLSQLTLSLIDGGLPWLNWAIASPSARYDFPDETLLVDAVQQGLHATPYILLPALKLMVSPVKLMTLGLEDLRVLAHAQQQGQGQPQAPRAAPASGQEAPSATLEDSIAATQLRRVLNMHHLLTQTDLAAGGALLVKLGLSSAPIFQSLTLADRTALCDLVHVQAGTDAATPVLQQEAAAFALAQAHTPLEFTDYYKIYMTLAARPQSLSATRDERASQATALIHALLPQLFKALDCPQLPGLPSPAQVMSAVHDWLTLGRRMGFSRLSQGAQQAVQHADLPLDPGGLSADTLHGPLERYLAHAQTLLAAQPSAQAPMRSRMGQDGATCVYLLASDKHQARLQRSGDGVISLCEFGPRPASPHPATHDPRVAQPQEETTP